MVAVINYWCRRFPCRIKCIGLATVSADRTSGWRRNVVAHCDNAQPHKSAVLCLVKDPSHTPDKRTLLQSRNGNEPTAAKGSFEIICVKENDRVVRINPRGLIIVIIH